MHGLGRGARGPVDGDHRWCPTWRRAFGRPSSTARRWPTCPAFRRRASLHPGDRSRRRPDRLRARAARPAPGRGSDRDPRRSLGPGPAPEHRGPGAANGIRVLVGLSLIAIVLSTAAVYALMSFTVARRTREIGVRIALGGRSSRIVATIAGRPLRQLVLGVLLGAGFWAVVFASLGGRARCRASSGSRCGRGRTCWLSRPPRVVATGLLACLAPILRGLGGSARWRRCASARSRR